MPQRPTEIKMWPHLDQVGPRTCPNGALGVLREAKMAPDMRQRAPLRSTVIKMRPHLDWMGSKTSKVGPGYGVYLRAQTLENQ